MQVFFKENVRDLMIIFMDSRDLSGSLKDLKKPCTNV